MAVKKPQLTSKIGALVRYCGHKGVFVADIIAIEGAAVVRPSGPVTPETLDRSSTSYAKATHHVVDYPSGGFWRPDLGVFVVPANQVTVLTGK